MMTNNNFTILLLKVLKRLGFLRYVKHNFKINFNNRRVLIPVSNTIGYSNLYLNEDSLNHIYKKLCGSITGTFVDVGINIGQTLIKVKTINENLDYIGFEPNIVCLDYVKRLIDINKYSGCRLEQYALADKRQQIELHMNMDVDQSASIIKNLRPAYFSSSYTVNCLPFDDLGISNHISFIKIDVEGAELEVLLGMQESIGKFKPVILCEVLDSYSDEVFDFTQSRASDVSTLLKRLDYVILQLKQGKDSSISVRKIESIKIKQWSIESAALNDYIFCHASDYDKIVSLLS
jgi:FkbM family methyltransferase